MPSIASNVWCFTLNNPTTDRITWDPLLIGYAVYQKEVGEEGTPHFQGYVEAKKQMRLPQMIKMFQAHWTVARRVDKAHDYCLKEDTRVDGPWTFGCRTVAGKRTDIEALKRMVDDGATRDEIYLAMPDALDRYPRMLAYGLERAKRQKVLEIVLDPRPWQSDVIKIADSDPDERKVYWYSDIEGNQGKTYLAKYLVQKYGAYYNNGGKGADILFGYDSERVVIFDYVRDSKDFVNYGVIEQLKNGILYSPKYQSTMKVFPIPHVFVFANFRPDESKMSSDRWVITDLPYPKLPVVRRLVSPFEHHGDYIDPATLEKVDVLDPFKAGFA